MRKKPLYLLSVLALTLMVNFANFVEGVGPGPDVKVMDDEPNRTQFEPAVAINPKNTSEVVAVAMDYRDCCGREKLAS